MVQATAAPIPSAESAARIGLRPRSRSTIRPAGERSFPSPARSSQEGWNVGGASGRIASAGARRTALRTAPATARRATAAARIAAARPTAGSDSYRMDGKR